MSKTVNITIDGKQYGVPEGKRVLWAALENGVYIPHLCGIEEEDKPSAGCRLCFVEIEGFSDPVASCTQPVKEGMVVQTRSERIDRLVKNGFELLLSNHSLNCGKCAANGSCELQKIAKERGLKLRVSRMRKLDNAASIDDSPEKFSFDPAKCVLCGRCVWVDHNKAKVGAIGFVRRGMRRRVATFGETFLAESNCTQCGECVPVCPTGALFKKA
ncbi:2Fe-2S iron-sulfur cluster-binding protein [Phosphitispora sp. TUW77]|uniref:2Fe-2S iron-sulfur cluster-binding protein n=1 Tax=Phosphitispora sp. TUW77 TaxID=3152361 RepID=UPI003AB6FEB1